MSVVELTTPQRTVPAAGRASAELDYACRLDGGTLVMKGSTTAALTRIATYRESTTSVTAPPAITFPQAGSPARRATGFLSVVSEERIDRKRRLDLGPVRLTVDPAQLGDRLVPPAEMASRLSALDGGTRHRCMDLLTCALARGEGFARVPLAGTLFGIRELLRERLPVSCVDPAVPKSLYLDALFAVDERSFYVRGWMRNAQAQVSRLLAVSPEGRTADITGRLIRYARPDVSALFGSRPRDSHLGFLGYFELPVPSLLQEGWVFLMFDGAGGAVEAQAPAVTEDPHAVRTALLADLVHEGISDRLLSQHTFPAVSRLQERMADGVEIAGEVRFGPVPSGPEVSIVVPLYKRIDFVDYHLAQFVHDPDLRDADLVYVLDSPEQAEELLARCRQLYALYGVAFRLIVLNRNGGFSAANNAGASVARGRRLLLMNSDVLPRRPGWLSSLARFYGETEGIGALGPKLLYAEGSLQHAGMHFRRSAETETWINAHHFQGLAGTFPPANVCRPVAGITGACLMIDRGLYESVGGLRGMYVQGDFEDSDLCLRLAELGRTNWYLPEVEMYHLEGQSYPNELRRMTFRYNCWLHSLLWGDRISQMKEDS